MKSGATREMSNDNICTINVVPTLAPSIAASPGTRSTSPPAAKPVTISPVAVLLCNTAVIPEAGEERLEAVAECGPENPPQVRSERALNAALDHMHAPQQQRD